MGYADFPAPNAAPEMAKAAPEMTNAAPEMATTAPELFVPDFLPIAGTNSPSSLDSKYKLHVCQLLYL